MSETPVGRIIDALQNATGQHPRPTASGWRACCPAHDDRRPSLSVSEGNDGSALLKCHAGCSIEEICQALGLDQADLFPASTPSTSTNSPETREIRESVDVDTLDGRKPVSQSSPEVFPSARDAVAALERRQGTPSAEWTYHDAHGSPVGMIVRWNKDGGKDIRPVRRNGAGWKIGGMPEPRPLYRLPELAKAKRVYVTEGEKAADAAGSIGLTATTSPHGSKAAHKADWSPLAGKEVVLLPDNDAAGRKYAEGVAGILANLRPPAKVKLVELSDLPDGGGDIHDWLEQRDAHDTNELRQTVDALADQAGPFVPAPTSPPVARYVPFPVDLLPEPVRRFVADGAKAIGCDPSFVVLPCLAVLGAAIGTSRRLQLKRGWSAPPIIWAVIVGESGTSKTPAFKLVMGPVRKRQGRALQRHEEAIKVYEVELQRHEKDYAAWKRDKSGDDPPEAPELPQAERFVVSDTTVEALAPLLKGNPRGLLLARDELAGWIGSFDRYASGQGADAAHWLTMHNGESIIVDRKTGQQRTIYVPTAAVSVTGGIQPAILNKALGSEHRESGLAARLLLACPPRRPKRWTEADIDPLLVGEVADLLDRLYALQPTVDEDGDRQPIIVDLAPKAKIRWIEFYDSHNEEQAELTGELAAAWSKLEEYAARLALVIHFVRWAADDPTLASAELVDDRSISAGIQLVRWFRHEARRVYALLSESDEEHERRELVDLIGRLGGRITPRGLAQKSRKYQPASVAEAALEELAKSGVGYWECVETCTKPRREFVLWTGVVSTHSPPAAGN